MNLNAIVLQVRAEQLIKACCPEYKFQWSSAKRQAGYCDWTNKTISLSYHHACNSTLKFNEDTILHEIAHAMTEGHHHDEVWRKAYLLLGGSGKRLYDAKDCRKDY